MPEGQRAAVFDEALTVVRALLDTDEVSFSGRFFQIDNVSLGIRAPSRVDLWLGGSAPAAFRRIGRLADGWLGSFLTPDEARQAARASSAPPPRPAARSNRTTTV